MRYLSQIENGKAIALLDVLATIAAELGVLLAALLSEHTDPEPPATLTTAPDVVRALMAASARHHRPIGGVVALEARCVQQRRRNLPVVGAVRRPACRADLGLEDLLLRLTPE
jgi:transcriptional regulator with XRE-family HTH domain